MIKRLRRKRGSNNFLPFSKKLLGYSRWECWIMTVAIFLMTIFKIETGNLYQIVLTGWAGYGVAKALYYNMAKSDHQIQLIKEVDPKADDKIRTIIQDNLVEKLKEAIIQELKVEDVELDGEEDEVEAEVKGEDEVKGEVEEGVSDLKKNKESKVVSKMNVKKRKDAEKT